MKCDMSVGELLRTRGWEVVEGVFPREEAESLAAFALEHVDMVVDTETGDKEARKVSAPFKMHERFRNFILSENLRLVLRQMLGGLEPLLCRDQIFMKPPKHGSAKPYHQDNAYFRCEPADHVITAWVALDDVDESNGCLRYIDGSHLEPELPHKAVQGETYNMTPDPELIDLSRESLAIVKKGGVVFHHGNVLHTSHRNHSDRWRRGYASHWVTPDVTCEGSTLKTAYFNAPDYPRKAAR